MWQLVTLLTSSPAVLFLALPYWPPCSPHICHAHFYSWSSVLIFPFVLFFPNNCNGQAPQFFAQMLSSQVNFGFLIHKVEMILIMHLPDWVVVGEMPVWWSYMLVIVIIIYMSEGGISTHKSFPLPSTLQTDLNSLVTWHSSAPYTLTDLILSSELLHVFRATQGYTYSASV